MATERTVMTPDGDVITLDIADQTVITPSGAVINADITAASPLALKQRGNSRTVRANNEGTQYFFTVGIDSADSTKLACVRTTDPATSIGTVQDASNQPVTNNGDIEAYHYDVADNKLHITFQQDGTSTEDVFYSCFDMGTNAWVDLGTSDYEMEVHQTGTAGQFSCMIAVQFDYIIIVCASAPEVVTSGRTRVSYYTSITDGATWVDQGHISGGGGAFNEAGPRVLPSVEGSSQMVWVNNDGGNFNMMAATLQNDFTLQAAQDTGFNCGSLYALGWPAAIYRGALILNFPHAGAGGDTRSLRCTATTAVTSFASDQITTAGSYSTGTYFQTQVACVYDGFNSWCVHINSTDRDIDHFLEAALGSYAWSAEGTLQIGTFDSLALSFYDNAGPKLGLTYAAGTTIAYSETDENTVHALLSDVDLGFNVSYHGPFLLNSKLYTVMVEASKTRLVMMEADNTTPADGDWDSQGKALVLPVYDGVAQHWNPSNTKNSTGVRSIRCVQIGDTVEVYATQECGTLTRSVFDEATDTWTTRVEHIANGWDTNFGGVTFGVVHAGYDATNGHRICAANWHEKTTPYAKNDLKVRIWRKASGGSWTNLGNGGGSTASTDYHVGALIGPDSSDGFTLTYTDVTNNAVYGRYIDSSGTIGSPFTIDAAVDTAALLAGKGVVIGSTVYAPYVDAANDISIADFTAGTSPTVNITTGASSNAAYNNGATANPQPNSFFGLDVVDSAAVLTYVSSTDQDMWQDTQTPAAVASITVNGGLSSNYLSAGLGIGIVYSEGVSDVTTYVAYTPVAASSFQPAWARNANQIIQQVSQ